MGAVVSVTAAGVASLMAPTPAAPVLPDLSADALERQVTAPATDEVRAETPRDSDIATQEGAPMSEGPAPDDVDAVSAAGADQGARPEASATGGGALGGMGLTTPPAPQVDVDVSVETVAPVLPSPQAALPAQPQSEAALSISTEPAQPPAPQVADETAFAPVVPQSDALPPVPQDPDAEGTLPALGAAAEEEVIAAEPDVPAQEAEAPETTVVTPPAPATELPLAGFGAGVADEVETPRLQQRVGSLVDRDAAGGEDAPETEAVAEAVAPDQTAIKAYAAAFTPDGERPLMSIVLIDSGQDLSGGNIGLVALRSFPYPVSFAVDATLPDAADRAAAFYAEGFEVLALVDLPRGATAANAEVSLAAAMDAVPQAVGILEGTAAGLQSDMATAAQVTSIAAASGHGLLLQSKGLNSAQKQALRDGVPAATVFRDFDSAGQTPTVMRRFLDQAAFRAGQEGGVVMLGRLQPDTISALLLWGLQERATRVDLAPVSAVLRAKLTP